MSSIKRKCRDHLESLDAHSCRNSCSSAFCCVYHMKSIILRYDILLAPCTYPVVMVHDRWGATDIAALSLHLILLSASLRALQNFNQVHSEILFSQRFFCRPLLLPPCTLDTRPNHLNLRFLTVVKISS